jgi:predicted O-methyltransferase YrrM
MTHEYLEKYTMLNSTLRELLAEMEVYNHEHSEALAIPHDEGLFLHMQVLMLRPERIIELGTSTGYSTVWLGSAAAGYGGRVETVEFDPDKIALAQRNIGKAGLNDTVTIHRADANEFVGDLTGVIDMVFMDTEKREYLSQFKRYWPLLRSGGAVYADNAVDLRDDMMDYLEHVKGLPDALSVTDPIGNGVEITLKL